MTYWHFCYIFQQWKSCLNCTTYIPPLKGQVFSVSSWNTDRNKSLFLLFVSHRLFLVLISRQITVVKMFYFESGLLRSKAAIRCSGVETCIIVHTAHPAFETAAAVITWLPLAVIIISIICLYYQTVITVFKILFSRLFRPVLYYDLSQVSDHWGTTVGTHLVWASIPDVTKIVRILSLSQPKSSPKWDTGLDHSLSVTSCRYAQKIVRMGL